MRNQSGTIETYIAKNNPDDVLVLLRSLNSPKPRNPEHMLQLLHQATEKFPDKVFEALAKIETPYYQLIMSNLPQEEMSPRHSNCSGGGCKCGGNATSSCDGVSNVDAVQTQPVKTTNDGESKDNKNIFVMPSFITQHPIASGVIGTVLGVALIVGVVKLLK